MTSIPSYNGPIKQYLESKSENSRRAHWYCLRRASSILGVAATDVRWDSFSDDDLNDLADRLVTDGVSQGTTTLIVKTIRGIRRTAGYELAAQYGPQHHARVTNRLYSDMPHRPGARRKVRVCAKREAKRGFAQRRALTPVPVPADEINSLTGFLRAVAPRFITAWEMDETVPVPPQVRRVAEVWRESRSW